MFDTNTPWPASDDFYQALIEAHQGLSEEDSHALNARLILLLAQHVRDMDTLRAALAIARSPELAAA
ncbi:DUF2783 domain-containing protein [Comamonas sp. J-3]|uniref:DUF2783 domain-containing protein n=1 Tax=Comamonas trifloxystrobinivorans TaxID=3350256 RepID=UPI0037266063